MKRILSLAATAGLIAVGVIAPTAAQAASCEPRTEITSGTMSPTSVVVGTSAVKNGTFTMKVTSCYDFVLANAAFYRGSYGFNYADMEEVGHSGDTYTFRGNVRYDPRDLVNTDAGTWLSESTVFSETDDEEYTSNFYLQRAATLTTNATPEPIAKGRTLTVNGTLKRANWDTSTYGGYGSQTVALQFRTPSGAYKNVKTAKSDSKGNLKTTVTAGVDGCYRWQYTANPTSTSEATSVGDCVDVR